MLESTQGLLVGSVALVVIGVVLLVLTPARKAFEKTAATTAWIIRLKAGQLPREHCGGRTELSENCAALFFGDDGTGE